MTELLTAAQMRSIEQAAIDSGEVTGLELMERAGRGVVEAIFEEWPELKAGTFRAVVLCGPGNNGGDGFVVARLLKDWGWEVEVFLYGDAEKLPPDARVNYERWGEMGEVAPLQNGFWLPKCDLHIDALFGTGLSRRVDRKISYSLTHLHKSHPHFRAVAVDIPSGLCADSGRAIEGIAGKADLTVTFHKVKLGHVLAEGGHHCGRVVVKDLGLPVSAFSSIEELMEAVNTTSRKSEMEVAAEFDRSKAERIADISMVGRPSSGLIVKRGKSAHPADTHKYTHGHALILSGPSGATGAARLAARGALRIGAGLVTLGVPPAAQSEVASRVTAVMLREVGDAAALVEVLGDNRISALCIGPGMGVDRAWRLVSVALGGKGDPGSRPGKRRGVVLDADALTAFEDDPEVLFDMLHEGCILTPHAGEFRRLFSDIADKLDAPATSGPAYSKVDATREAARRAGCVVLFKGPDTVIAAPDGRCSINSAHYDRAAPWLATAGSGDVLAGFITGLLARGFAPMQAAETAAWLHVECARSFGPGLIAEDLPEELPKVFRALGMA